jgi:hypothetical protein
MDHWDLHVPHVRRWLCLSLYIWNVDNDNEMIIFSCGLDLVGDDLLTMTSLAESDDGFLRDVSLMRAGSRRIASDAFSAYDFRRMMSMKRAGS